MEPRELEQLAKLFIFYAGGDAGNSNIELQDVRFSLDVTPESYYDDLRAQWWGSSLTTVDAIRTIARSNGHFALENSKLLFRAISDSQQFRVVMYSHNGLLLAFEFGFLANSISALQSKRSAVEL